jgi:hypothetical protein
MKRKNVSKFEKIVTIAMISLLVMVLAITIFGVFMGWSIKNGLQEEANHQLHLIQSTVNEQCGFGKYIVNHEHFYTDLPRGPRFSWYSEHVICEGTTMIKNADGIWQKTTSSDDWSVE